MSRALTHIPKLVFSEPCHNLPGRKGTATEEDRFTISFMRAYLDQAEGIHRRSQKTSMAFAREIPVNGYGITDLLVVAWQALSGDKFSDARAFARVARPTTRAFECKLADWRKGMSQAGRYRFFANQAFVVLPERTYERALPFLNTFRAIQVGLWSFSPDSGRITAHFTPRARTPRSERYHLHAIECVHRASNQVLPISRKG